METINGKRLSTEVLNERRRQAVKLRLGGMNLATVAETVGLARGTIISAMKAYKAGGWKAVAVKARGRSIGDGRTLSEEQEKTIRAMICDRTPDQLKLPYALWTRSAVGT
jgi:transposase